MLFVVFTVALLTGTDLPYALAATVRSSAGQIVRPAHLLASAALFMVILSETGRIPVETHTGTNEFGMIDEARPFEHSGPYFALLKWGSELKQLILYTILANVFLAPWGLASTQQAGSVLLAIVALLAKATAIGAVVAVIDNSFAKLRLFKITEFVAGAFLLAVLGVFTLGGQRDVGHRKLRPGARAGSGGGSPHPRLRAVLPGRCHQRHLHAGHRVPGRGRGRVLGRLRTEGDRGGSQISGAALLAGLLLLASESHSIALASFARVPGGTARTTALVLLLGGFAVKAGLVGGSRR